MAELLQECVEHACSEAYKLLHEDADKAFNQKDELKAAANFISLLFLQGFVTMDFYTSAWNSLTKGLNSTNAAVKELALEIAIQQMSARLSMQLLVDHPAFLQENSQLLERIGEALCNKRLIYSIQDLMEAKKK